MIQSYFRAEKQGGFVALSLGIFTCFVAGCIFLAAAPPFYTGLGIPLILIGIIQMAVGSAIARRTDRQADDLEQLLADDPAGFSKEETERMAVVLRNFNTSRWIETGVASVGGILVLLNQEAGFLKGLGAGMVIQAVIMFVFDYFAEKRGLRYAEFVKKADF